MFAAALAGAGLVLASRPADEIEAQAPAAPRTLPATAAAMPAAAAKPAQSFCSAEQQLAGWQLLSTGAGGYRQAGFAVLYHPQRGTVTVAEGAAFDNGLIVERVTLDGVQLRCGADVRSLALPLANGAAPAMRSALPDPDHGRTQ